MNIRVLSLVAIALFLVQCAKKEDDDFNVREQQSLDIWMKANRPEATRMESGMYIEWIEGGPNTRAEGTPVAGKDWVSVDYEVRDLDGNVIATRNAEVAQHEMTYTPVTHYTPHFARFTPAQEYFTRGEYEALGMMEAGDRVHIYMPAYLAYETADITFKDGYEGWAYSTLNPKNALGVRFNGRPVAIDLTLLDVVSDPEECELEQVEARAQDDDMQLIVDTIPGLYYKYVRLGGEAIPKDSLLHVTYTCRFLDGKLVATNDPEVALAEWEDYGSAYTGTTAFRVGNMLIGPALGFLIRSDQGYYDSTVKLLFVSEYGYGVQGQSSSKATPTVAPHPAVYPYTPLTMEISIKPKEFEPEEEV